MTKTLLLIASFLLSVSNADSQDFGVEPQSISKLKLVKQFQLQEDAASPILDIGHLSFNPSGTMFSISSYSSPKMFMYSSKEGKLIKLIGTTLELIDSISFYQAKIWPNETEKFYLLNSEQLRGPKGKVLSEAEMIKKFETRFSSASFINDSVIVGWGGINLMLVEKTASGYEKSYTTLPLFCKYDVAKDHFAEVHPLSFERLGVFPSAVMQGLCFDKEKNETSVAIHDDESKNHNDTIRILGKFDGTGKGIRKLWLPFPEEHIRSSLGPNFLNVKSCIVGNHQFAVFKTVPKIYDITNQSSFPVMQVPTGNRMLFSLSLKNSTLPGEALATMVDFHLYGIYKHNNDVVVTGDYRDTDQAFISFVQVYDMGGTLKSMYEIKDEKIQNIGFSEADRSIVLFRLDRDAGWSVAYHQIDK